MVKPDAPSSAALPATGRSPSLRGRLSLETPLGAVLSDSRIRLLEAIDRCGSLNRAAREVPLSYKAAWDALETMNQLAPEPLVRRATGGKGGGGTQLTDAARQLIALYRAMEHSQQHILDRLDQVPAAAAAARSDAPALRSLIGQLAMKTSARNQFRARVCGLHDEGGLVSVELAPLLSLPEGDSSSAGAKPGQEAAPTALSLSATITPESLASMGMALGSEVFVLLKAPCVAIATEAPAQRQRGRNALPGVVQSLRPGPSHTGVSLWVAPFGERTGLPFHAVVSHDQAGALSLGQPVWAEFEGEQVVLVSFG